MAPLSSRMNYSNKITDDDKVHCKCPENIGNPPLTDNREIEDLLDGKCVRSILQISPGNLWHVIYSSAFEAPIGINRCWRIDKQCDIVVPKLVEFPRFHGATNYGPRVSSNGIAVFTNALDLWVARHFVRDRGTRQDFAHVIWNISAYQYRIRPISVLMTPELGEIYCSASNKKYIYLYT